MNSKILKEKISSGQPIIGTWNTFGSSMATKVLASSGLDFQIIDFEHGPFSLHHVHDHITSSAIYDCSCLVRVPENEAWMCLQALDQGAEGVVIPQVSGEESALKAVENIKYYPSGNRGFSPFTFSGDFTNASVSDFHKKSNDNSVLVILLETVESLNSLQDIIKIPEIDVIYIGAYDLSKSLGIPGDIYNEKVVNIVKKATKEINSSGKIAGSFVPQNMEEIKFCLDLGLRFITYSVDTHELKKAFSKARKFIDTIKKS